MEKELEVEDIFPYFTKDELLDLFDRQAKGFKLEIEETKQKLVKLEKDSEKTETLFNELTNIIRYFKEHLPKQFIKDVREAVVKRNSN